MTDFSPEKVLSWFDEKYKKLLAHRAMTMREALWLTRKTNGRLIVETGCVRKEGNWAGDGQSTLLFAAYGARFKSALMTVDIDPAATRLATRLVKDNTSTDVHVSIRTGDAVEHIDAVNQPIDLLYLDSKDFNPENPGPSQEQALREFNAAEKWLHEESVVLIDDCDLPHGGKGGQVIPEMVRRGWKVRRSEYQVLLTRG